MVQVGGSGGQVKKRGSGWSPFQESCASAQFLKFGAGDTCLACVRIVLDDLL